MTKRGEAPDKSTSTSARKRRWVMWIVVTKSGHIAQFLDNKTSAHKYAHGENGELVRKVYITEA